MQRGINFDFWLPRITMHSVPKNHDHGFFKVFRFCCLRTMAYNFRLIRILLFPYKISMLKRVPFNINEWTIFLGPVDSPFLVNWPACLGYVLETHCDSKGVVSMSLYKIQHKNLIVHSRNLFLVKYSELSCKLNRVFPLRSEGNCWALPFSYLLKWSSITDSISHWKQLRAFFLHFR